MQMSLINKKLTGCRTFLTTGLVFSLLLAMTSGCITSPVNPHQMTRYSPNTKGVDVGGRTGAIRPSDVDIVSSRPLRPGDPIIIHLRGILKPEIIEDMVDSRGSINLPFIGSLRVEGKTTSEAELLIETTYKEKRIYKQINVIVVAQQAEFFIQGEVKMAKGRYPLTADLTLLRAVATAGGPTRFAHPRNVDIIRDGEILSYDRKKIRDGKAVDPLIKPDDMIIVRKRKI